jgi:hypothetical protein
MNKQLPFLLFACVAMLFMLSLVGSFDLQPTGMFPGPEALANSLLPVARSLFPDPVMACTVLGYTIMALSVIGRLLARRTIKERKEGNV